MKPRPRLTILGATVAVSALAACSSITSVDGLLVSDSAEYGASGAVCGPPDKDGIASFAIEGVRNVTAHDLTVTAVHFEGSHVEVLDWFLKPMSWEAEGGVRGGRFPGETAPGPTTIGGGQTQLVAMTLKVDGAPPLAAMPISVTYQSFEGTGAVQLAFRVEVPAPGRRCVSPE